MLDRIKDILVEYTGVARDEIGMETGFVEDLGLSSLDVVDLVVTFEEEFEVVIPERKLLEIITVADVVELLGELCEK